MNSGGRVVPGTTRPPGLSLPREGSHPGCPVGLVALPGTVPAW